MINIWHNSIPLVGQCLSLPLDSRQRLAGDIICHPRDTLHLVDDSSGYLFQKLERQMGKLGGHEVHCLEGNKELVAW